MTSSSTSATAVGGGQRDRLGVFTKNTPRRRRRLAMTQLSSHPIRSGRYTEKSYHPSVATGDTPSSAESRSAENWRSNHFGLFECSYKLNQSDSKRVLVGNDLKNHCQPYIGISKVGGPCVVLDHWEWSVLLNNEELLNSYFYEEDVAPQNITLGRFVIKFKTIFGTKSIVIEDAEPTDTPTAVYLAKSSWNGLLNYTSCIEKRLEERELWRTFAERMVSSYFANIERYVRQLQEAEPTQNNEQFLWNCMCNATIDPVDGETPCYFNTQAASEEIRALIKSPSGKKLVQKMFFSSNPTECD